MSTKRSNTRRPQGEGSIRKRTRKAKGKNGKDKTVTFWEARYTVGRDSGTGKQIQKSLYGDTQDEVRKKLNEVTKNIDDGIYTDPEKMTVTQWLDIWCFC